MIIYGRCAVVNGMVETDAEWRYLGHGGLPFDCKDTDLIRSRRPIAEGTVLALVVVLLAPKLRERLCSPKGTRDLPAQEFIP